MSNTNTRVAKAREVLDRAERRYIWEHKDLFDALQKYWNGLNYAASNADTFRQLAENGLSAFDNSDNIKIIKIKAGVFGVISGTGNVRLSHLKGEDSIEKLIGFGTDVVLSIWSVTPVGFAVNTVNFISGMATGKDISSFLKDMYGKISGNGFEVDLFGRILRVTMDDGTIYAKEISENYAKFMGSNGNNNVYFGGTKDDVLIGGDKKDIFIGHGGNDIFVGNGGKDDYFVSYGDTIIDSDGAGRVFLGNSYQLKGGTQIEKGSKIYKGKDGVKYELKDNGDLLINDSITIENFSNDNLEIHLSEFDEINVSISDNQAVEKAGKMTFNIELSKEPELGQFVIVKVNDKTYKFVNFLETNYTFEDGVKLIHGSSATYEYTWSDDSLKEEDEKFEVSATATGSDGLKVSVIKNGNGLIKDDDQDNDPDPEREASPIVIDLGNDGINSHTLNYTINFDLDNNGFKEATGWVSGDDALLAIDKNNNGIIDNGSELFGNKSISDSAFSYTNSSLNNGFETLKSYDSNNDGIIDSQDAEFDKLLLWQDKNGNAITDNGELIKLSDKAEFANLNLLVA
ncbi:calcium-binding protein [Campylobacter ureolyticus]|uniref:calcium-binding protein n=1 Tax=Campylobacter ureolyticus TaxID=827 RepID=UPI002909E417|nr:calcium-binding protein [Campylobacter ureolyticus]MDU5325761.1 calcium-binding protein [Campylobacter ureolyticus]